ncbi:MAG: cyclopropane fatty acyl phospholipid synthase [Bacteroidota bacterium]
MFESKVREILSLADVRLNGDRPWDIRVKDGRFYRRVLIRGPMGLGESYMDGWWDCERLDELFYRILANHVEDKVRFTPGVLLTQLSSRIVNLQTRSGSRKLADHTYELTPELYTAFLDPYNQYTCGYFKDTEDLNKAQEQKLDLICRKLRIGPKDRVLDIGCGWGGFAKFCAEHYGCHVTGITISNQQLQFATELCKGLDTSFLLLDYRDLGGKQYRNKFDKILICGMIEHVGYKNYRNIMRIAKSCLSDGGLFLLHTIGGNISTTAMDTNPWMGRYIFPNSMLPSLVQLTHAAEGLFITEDVHNFSVHYDKTLMAWCRNFEANWPSIASQFDQRFYRMWRYYLLSCAGGFRARNTQLWQFVLSVNGVPGGYESLR